MKWLDLLKGGFVHYNTVTFDMKEAFPVMSRSLNVTVVPMAWLPIEVAGRLQNVQAELEALTPNTPEWLAALGSILGHIIVSWDFIDETTEEILPIPSKNPGVVGKLPMVLMNYIMEKATEAGGEVPLASERPLPELSSTPASEPEPASPNGQLSSL